MDKMHHFALDVYSEEVEVVAKLMSRVKAVDNRFEWFLEKRGNSDMHTLLITIGIFRHVIGKNISC